jgi:nucleotide-binding universal stress UspA family protein
MKTTRILVPDDFTEASREALRFARAMGHAVRPELHLLHVVPDARHEPWARDVEDLDLDVLTEEWIRDAGIRLHRRARELRPTLDLHTAVRLGTAPEQIVSYAAERHADVIVLGAHRDLRSAEWLCGGISERVVRKATCPVLTVPGGGRDVAPIDDASAVQEAGGPPPAIRTVLIPIDFTAGADLALSHGLALAREHGATAYVLHVYDPPWTRNLAYTPPPAHVTEELRLGAERRLARAIDRHDGALFHVRTAVRVGDPYVEIVHYAGEIRCGLIVVGTHSRHTIGRLPLGSVAQKLLRRAPCPILTVGHESVRFERDEPGTVHAAASVTT